MSDENIIYLLLKQEPDVHGFIEVSAAFQTIEQAAKAKKPHHKIYPIKLVEKR